MRRRGHSVYRVLLICAAIALAYVVGGFRLDGTIPAFEPAMAADNIVQVVQASDEARLTQRIDAIYRRQIRQDRVLGFGFGVTLLLLVGVGTLLWTRLRIVPGAAKPAPIGQARPPKAAEPAGPSLVERLTPFLDRLGRLRRSAQLAGVRRRQKRIMRLLADAERSISGDIEARRGFSEALSELRGQIAALDDDIRAAAAADAAETPHKR
jgi:hypothetical protein